MTDRKTLNLRPASEDTAAPAVKRNGPGWLKLAIAVVLFGLALGMLAEAGQSDVIPISLPFAFLAGWFFLFRKPGPTKTHD